MSADQFWDRVRHRLGLDGTTARQVTEAVLETLAERIAAGQVEDLIAQLDPLLHPPPWRGVSSAAPGARRMPLEEFLQRVAVREGARVDEADLFDEVVGHVRAVFATRGCPRSAGPLPKRSVQRHRTPWGPREDALLAVTLGAFVIVPPFVSLYQTGDRIARMQRTAGLTPTCSPVAGFLLMVFLFGSGILYYQAELDKIWDHYGNPPKGSAIPLAAMPA
jgi:uncharacterized protein (DUF2267 family)